MAANALSLFVMAGLDPAIHVFLAALLLRRGCPASFARTPHSIDCTYFFPVPGSVPIILHNTDSITSSAPPPIEVRRLSR